MKCSFYETTGNLNCPFHNNILKRIFWPNGSIYIAHLRIKPIKRRSKTTRRYYGKS